MRRWSAILLVMSLALAALPMAAGAQVVDSVLVYTGGGLAFEYQFHTLFGGATGKSVVVSETLPPPLLLAEYDCVILPGNSDLSAATTTLVSYVQGGGRLIAEGEGADFPLAIAAMNGLANALGSSMDLVPAELDSGFHVTTSIDPSPFTSFVFSITYAYTSGLAVSVGATAHSLVRTFDDPENSDDVPTTFIGVEQIGSGVFALSGDSNVFSNNSADGYSAHDNDVLAANICDQANFEGEPEDDVDLSVTKVAEQDNVIVNGDAAFTITVTNNSESDVATGVTVDDQATFSGGGSVGIQSASGEGWTCGEGGLPPCTLDDPLPAAIESSELLVIVQAPGSTGTITNTATVSGDQPDEIPGNNSDDAQVTVQAANSGSVETFLQTSNVDQTLATQGGQAGWNSTMTVPPGSPAGVYRLTEIPDPVQGSKGAVTYLAPAGAQVFVQMTCFTTQCPKRRVLDLLVLVIKTDDNGQQHLLPPCHLVIRVGRRNIIIDRPAPCVVSVTRANAANAPLIWTVKVKGGPDPGLRGR